MDRRQLATLAVVAAASLFGTTGTVLARGPADTTAIGVGTVRLLIGGASLLAIASLRRERVVSIRPWIPSMVAGGIAVACYQLLFFEATTRAGVALGTVTTIGSGPVFSGMIETVRTRTLPRRGWLVGTACAVVGVILLGVVGRATSPDLVGMACALGSGLGWATYATIGRAQIERGLPSTLSMASMFSVAGVLCAPLLLFQPLSWLSTVDGWRLVLYLGVVTVGVAYTLYGWGLRSLTAPTVITLTLAEPITATVLAFAVLDESIGAWGLAGIAMVAAGLVVTAREATSSPGTVRRT